MVSPSIPNLDRPFTYRIPGHLVNQLSVGSYVLVPFGSQRLSGYVIGFTQQKPPARLKNIICLLADQPLFTEQRLGLAQWVAQRYYSPLMDALRCVMPPGLSRRSVTTVTLTEAGRRDDSFEKVARAPRQRQVLSAIQNLSAPVSLDNLVRKFQHEQEPPSQSAVMVALRSLQDKGLVNVGRSLGQPRARRVTQQVAVLAETDRPWPSVIDELAPRASRQAETIAELLAARGEPVVVAELPRSSVLALADKGLVHIYEQRRQRLPEEPGLGNEAAHALEPTGAQACILQRLAGAIDHHRHEALLIHGITGSGKTEVYLQAIESTLQAGRSGIVLVPEISLTPQMVGRFRARFGSRLALFHSGLSPGERYDEWGRVKHGEADIVIGARSAVFAPCQNLGIVVVDEEHEGAYKQESSPRYNATAVAAERARREQAVLLLGSATPSIETYCQARAHQDDTLSLMELPQRIDNRPLPHVDIIDLRQETVMGKGGTFSQLMLEAIDDRLNRDEQVILFLNRRGFSTFVMCRECGWALRCPDCAVSLTYHHRSRTMRCHHCDYSRSVPDQCPNCEGYNIGFHGLGTERVADQVQREFDKAVVARMDRDTVTTKGAYGRILRRFAAGEANVLVGTQMIAKGLDFPEVTLVGVLNADVGLHRPDFRAAERTFQVLTQVAGRAGRADKPGEVLVQTYNPDHYAIAAAQNHDYRAFYEQEIATRHQNLYPPFVELANIIFSDEDADEALNTARRAAVSLQDMGVFFKKGKVQFLGPAEAPLYKLRGRYRYQMLIKAPDIPRLHETIQDLTDRLGEPGSTTVVVDIQPIDMM